MNEGLDSNFNSTHSPIKVRHLISQPTSQELPSNYIQSYITSQTQLKEPNQVSVIKGAKNTKNEEMEGQPSTVQKSKKKVISLNPQKISISRAQPNIKMSDKEGERQTPIGTPSTMFRNDDMLSPTRSPSNMRTLDVDFLTEADLLLSRTSSMTVTSPIGKHSFTTRIGLARQANNIQGYTSEEQYEILKGGQSPIGSSPLYRPGSITSHFESVTEGNQRVERNEINNNFALSHKKRESKVNMANFVPEERKENPRNNLSPEHDSNQVPRIQLTPLNLDRSFMSDQRDREVTIHNIQGDVLDFGDVSRANVTHAANINADTTAAAILNNNNNNNQQREQPQQNEQADTENTGYQPTENDIEIYLRRRTVLFLALVLGYMFCNLLESNKISYHALFGTLYFYLAYQLAEGVFGTFFAKRIENWQKRENALNIVDTICSILAAIWVHLKLQNTISGSILACVPLFVSSIIYFFQTQSPDSIKRFAFGIRTVILLQLVLITLKIDDTLSLEWTMIFVIAWIFLGIVAIHFFAYFIFCLLLVFSILFKQYQPESISLKIQLMGFLWHILYYGLSILTFLFLFGFTQAYDPKPEFRSTSILDSAVLINIIINGILLVYSLIIFKPLAGFIKLYSMANSSENQEVGLASNKPKIKLQVEKKSSYFVMLSSTYFLPLNHDLLAKNKKNLQRIKVNLDSSPKNQWKVKNERQENKLISVKTLQQYKENLDETWDRFSKKNLFHTGDDTTKSAKSRKSFKMVSARFPDPPELDEIEPSPFDIKVVARPNSKQNLSADDIENVQKLEANENLEKPDDEEKLCYLCYAQAPDAVLMNCGHGGICYECAIATVKAKNECVECRAPIVAIHKVDPNPKMKDVLKSVEYSKVILEMHPRVQTVNV